MAEGNSGGKGCKKKGRAMRKPCHKAYAQNHICQRNKIKRVFQSSGYDAANEYAKKNGIIMPQYIKDAAKTIRVPRNKNTAAFRSLRVE